MSKLKIELIAIADYTLTAEDKKLSVIGIFDKIFLKALPAAHPRLSFVVTLVGEPREEEKLVLRVTSPLGKDVFRADANVTLGENGKANMVSNFEGFPFESAGAYHFVLEKQGKEIASYKLEAILMKPAEKQIEN